MHDAFRRFDQDRQAAFVKQRLSHRFAFTFEDMYRKPKFLEELHAIREEMSREADYDMELFAEMARTGVSPRRGARRNLRGMATHAPRVDEGVGEASKLHIVWTERKRFRA